MKYPNSRAEWAEYYARESPGYVLMWWYMLLAEAERRGDL